MPIAGPCLWCSSHYSAELLACSPGTALHSWGCTVSSSRSENLKILCSAKAQLTSKPLCHVAPIWYSSRGPGRGKLADESAWLAQVSPASGSEDLPATLWAPRLC